MIGRQAEGRHLHNFVWMHTDTRTHVLVHSSMLRERCTHYHSLMRCLSSSSHSWGNASFLPHVKACARTHKLHISVGISCIPVSESSGQGWNCGSKKEVTEKDTKKRRKPFKFCGKGMRKRKRTGSTVIL